MRRRSGFTLMEMLIVIAVIAILVAIAIPVFASNLETARAATCAANRRSLKGELSMTYMADGVFPDGVKLDDNGAITLSDAQKQQYTCPDDGQITAKLDRTTGVITVSCSKHASEASLGSSETMTTITDALTKTASFDSGAAAVAPNSEAAKAVKALQEQGIDFKQLGAVSWYYANSSVSSKCRFYWTTLDISVLSYGTKVPVLCYNPSSGNYTVWIVPIGTGSTATYDGTYNILGQGTGHSGFTAYKPSTDEKSQTYDNALKYYQQVLDQYDQGALK